MKTLTFIVLLFFALPSSGQNTEASPQGIDIAWINNVLNRWDTVSRHSLHQPAHDLPWIIFYDSVFAWHLNPDKQLLPSYAKSPIRFQFGGKMYDLYMVSNSPGLWVPERKAINIHSLPTSTMPYSNNKKTFFISPLPSLFRQLAPPDQSFYLDMLFLGLSGHELTHTLQLPAVLPQVEKIQRDFKLPGSIDDNIIQKVFGKNEAYVKVFTEEKMHLWKAVAADNKDTCKAEILKALALKEERDHFFVGDSLGYKYLDAIILSLEGSAMWVQYQVTLSQAPKDQPWQQTLNWLFERTSSWSQEEGLALFILIDRLVPGWRDKFFNKELPSPFQILRDVYAK